MRKTTNPSFMQIALLTLICLCASIPILAQGINGQLFEQNLVRVSLNGEWQVSAIGHNDWIKATVPGCIHTDLMSAKRIPDPFFRDNERKVQWVGEQAWVY
jgi:hypothetical protein